MKRRTEPPAPDRPRRLRLTVTAAVGRALVPYLRRHLPAAHAILSPPLAELSLALVGDPAMSALHERFMGVPGPTDVLTFPLDEDEAGHALAGEVIVCVPEARRRAKAEGTDVQREVLLYALHGMLHLCGYDDLTPRQYARMHRAEDAILTELGVGAVFRPAVRTASSAGRASAGKVNSGAAASGRRSGTKRKITHGRTAGVRRRPGGG